MLKLQTIAFLIFIFLSTCCFSQIRFEPGHIVFIDGEKTDCLIKNIDWAYNPNSIEYKLQVDGVVLKGGLQNIKEFSINGASRYINESVKIDQSGKTLTNLSTEKKPVFAEEQLFLKVLTEGRIVLFQYKDRIGTKFFIRVGDSEINELINKRYTISDGIVGTNDQFRQQLNSALGGGVALQEDISKVAYSSNQLTKLIVKYEPNTTILGIRKTENSGIKKFSLALRPGINTTSLSISNSGSDIFDTNFEQLNTFRIGIEGEIKLPFNKNKWSIIVEPTYQYYRSESIKESNAIFSGFILSKIDYSSIEIPVGIKQYFFLKNGTKFHISAVYQFEFHPKDQIQFRDINGNEILTLEIDAINNFGLGIGYTIRNKYSVEFRYQTNQNLLANNNSWSSSYKTYSIIAGLRLFEK
jgi:hypothetical protein